MLSSCQSGYSCSCAGAAGCCGAGADDSEPERLVIDETGSDSSEEVDVLTVDPSERKRTKTDGNDSAFGSFADSPFSLPGSPFGDGGDPFDRWGSFGTLAPGSRIDSTRTCTNIDWLCRNMFWRDSGGGIISNVRRPSGFKGLTEWRNINNSDMFANQRGSREAPETGYQQSRANHAIGKDRRDGLGTYGRSWSHGETGIADSQQGRAESNMSENRRNSADTSVLEHEIGRSIPKNRKRCANDLDSHIQVDQKERTNVFKPERPSVIVTSPNAVDWPVPPVEQLLRFPSPPPDGISCKILTQPRSLMRFRYWSEYKDNRAANKILGKDSTTETATYPTLWIDGWCGKAVVVISLVQADNPQRLHPHSLLTPTCEEIKLRQGYIKREVHCTAPGTLLTLDNLCLIRNKKGQMVNLLRERYQKINPFGVAFDPKDATDIKAHVVRLCIEVYLGVGHAFYRLQPVVSDEIRNSGAHQTLKILKLGFCPPREGDYLQEVMILCDKVDKDDIEVEIVSLGPGGEALLKRVTSCDVFGQVSIVFRVSRDFLEDNHQHTFVRLRRPSTKDISEPFKFSLPRSISEHGVAERGRVPAPVTRSNSPGPSDPTNLALPTTSSGYTESSENRRCPDTNRMLKGDAECAPARSSDKETADNVPSDVVNFVSNLLSASPINDYSFKGSCDNSEIYKLLELKPDGSPDQQAKKDIALDIRINKDISQVSGNPDSVSSRTSSITMIQDPSDRLRLLETKAEHIYDQQFYRNHKDYARTDSKIEQDVCDSSNSSYVKRPEPTHPLDPYNLLAINPANTGEQSNISMKMYNRSLVSRSTNRADDQSGDDATLSSIIELETYDMIEKDLSGLLESVCIEDIV